MKTKKFDEALHSKYDIMGRDIVKKFITHNFSLDVIDHPDKCDVDLILLENEKRVAYVEVEVRPAWKTHAFLFEDLNVPARKKKLLQKELPVYFISINKNGTALFIGNGSDIVKCKREEVHNKYVSSGEYFYKVPLNILKLVDLTTGDIF